MNIVSACSDYGLVGILVAVKRIIKLLQIIAPIVCILSLGHTFIRLMSNPDNRKNLDRIRNSILALFIIFFVPTIVNISFSLLDDSTSISSCWELADYNNIQSTYIPIDNREQVSILYDPDSFPDDITKILDELIFYNQNSYSDISFCSMPNTVANSGCGAASFAMIASSYVNPGYNPRLVAKWLCTNKFSLSDGGLKERAVLSSDTLNHFGLKADVLFDKTGNNTYNYGVQYNSFEGSSMLKAVNSGKSVMFGMPGHWAVVGPNRECSSNKFYLYNPSRPTSNGCYTPEELFQYTYNYSNRCRLSNWCGWDIAIALSNKN